MHDMESLNAIQGMQQEAARVHNMHIDALQRVEKSIFEGVLLGTFFGVGFFAPNLVQSMGGLASVLIIKTIANMFHGFFVGFDFRGESQDHLDSKTFNKQAAYPETVSPDSDPNSCLLYTSPSPRDKRQSRMPSSA